MVEPVQGYLTKTGKFFESRARARLYEATTSLVEVLKANNMTTDLIQFLSHNQSVIQEFFNARDETEISNQVSKDQETGPTIPAPLSNPAHNRRGRKD